MESFPKAIGDSIGRTDSINISIVSSIIDQYGWLGQKEVGVKAMMGEFLTIHHADKDCFLKYYHIVKKAYKKHKLSRVFYEMYLDRRQEYFGKNKSTEPKKVMIALVEKVIDPIKR